MRLENIKGLIKNIAVAVKGEFEGMFPERWLPSTFAILKEPFTEQNQMINSTMKMVRGKIEKFYADRIDFLYSAEGKQIFNEKNLEAIG